MSSEQRTFVFSITFIIIFSVLVATIPIGLLGVGETPDMIIPVDPNTIAGFSDSEEFMEGNFTGYATYEYELNTQTWYCRIVGIVQIGMPTDWGFALGTKILIFGFLWLGGLESVKFVSSDGVDRGETLGFTEIDADAEDGTASYQLLFVDNGNAAGTFIIYWDTTTYSGSSDAWFADAMYCIHGVGLESSAVIDIGSLLIDLLTLQLPEVPLLVNIIIVVPIWAGIVYILWYIIKEMIPFL